jgi:hypothetical protein
MLEAYRACVHTQIGGVAVRTVLLALALLTFPLTAQEIPNATYNPNNGTTIIMPEPEPEPEPSVSDDVATFRAVLAEQLAPLQAIMVEQLKVMQEQRDEIKKLREQIGKQQACNQKKIDAPDFGIRGN